MGTAGSRHGGSQGWEASPRPNTGAISEASARELTGLDQEAGPLNTARFCVPTGAWALKLLGLSCFLADAPSGRCLQVDNFLHRLPKSIFDWDSEVALWSSRLSTLELSSEEANLSPYNRLLLAITLLYPLGPFIFPFSPRSPDNSPSIGTALCPSSDGSHCSTVLLSLCSEHDLRVIGSDWGHCPS